MAAGIERPMRIRELSSEAFYLWTQRKEIEKAVRGALQVGDFYLDATMFTEALHYYKQALAVSPLPHSLRAEVYDSVARAYEGLYESDLAVHYYQAALAESTNGGNPSARKEALTGLARGYRRQKQEDRARLCIEQARRLPNHDDDIEANRLYVAAQFDQDSGFLPKARESLDRALAIYQRTGNLAGQARTLSLISAVELASGKKDLALSNSERATQLAELLLVPLNTVQRKKSLWPAWLARARALRAAGNDHAAEIAYRRAIGYSEGLFWSTGMATDNSATGFGEEQQSCYRELADVLVDEGKNDEAFDYVEKARTKLIRALIRGRGHSDTPVNPETESALREMSRRVTQLRTQLLSGHRSAQQRDRLERKVREAEFARDEARIVIESEQSKGRFVWDQPLEMKPVQRLLRGDQTLLEFMLGEKRSFAWLISPTRVRRQILPGRAKIEDAVSRFLSLISQPPTRQNIDEDLAGLKLCAKEASNILLGELSEEVFSAENLIVVPDGILHYLPFEALVHNGRYLIEDRQISYLESASMMKLWQDSKKEIEPEDTMDFLAFGDPLVAPGAGSSKKTAGERAARGNDNQIRTYRGFNLPSLPRTRDEIEDVANLFPPDKRRIYLGGAATEDALKKEPLRRYKRIHFATHSLIDETSPWRSLVLLTLDNDPNEDGFLEASEICELDLNCDLVVLSACQTGRGQLLSGEGVVGLSWSFLYAGAKSAAVSLWNVTDISTAHLMKEFYQHLTQNVGNAAALRKAKLQMINGGGQTRHPYYWAPFVIIGRP